MSCLYRYDLIYLWKNNKNNKTGLILTGSKSITSSNSNFNLVIDGTIIQPLPTLCNLGVIFDSSLSFENHTSPCLRQRFFTSAALHISVLYSAPRMLKCSFMPLLLGSRIFKTLQPRVLSHTKHTHHPYPP